MIFEQSGVSLCPHVFGKAPARRAFPARRVHGANYSTLSCCVAPPPTCPQLQVRKQDGLVRRAASLMLPSNSPFSAPFLARHRREPRSYLSTIASTPGYPFAKPHLTHGCRCVTALHTTLSLSRDAAAAAPGWSDRPGARGVCYDSVARFRPFEFFLVDRVCSSLELGQGIL